MFFHGDDMKKLHQYIPADFWPKNYGGTLPEINYSGKEWYGAVEKRNQLYVDWLEYGFKWILLTFDNRQLEFFRLYVRKKVE